jgi:hypothetical protein
LDQDEPHVGLTNEFPDSPIGPRQPFRYCFVLLIERVERKGFFFWAGLLLVGYRLS